MFKKFFVYLVQYGFDVRTILNLRHYPLFRSQKKKWLLDGGKITHNFMILSDYTEKAGLAKGHYFHQDLLVSKFIFEKKPTRHVDIGSRLDGFVASVASYREIEVIDIRPLPKSEHENIKFMKADLMNPIEVGETDA